MFSDSEITAAPFIDCRPYPQQGSSCSCENGWPCLKAGCLKMLGVQLSNKGTGFSDDYVTVVVSLQ